MSSTTFNACRFFQSPQGCFRGTSCTFRHNEECLSLTTNASLLQSVHPSTTSSIESWGTRPPRSCVFFRSQTGCRNGGNCPFAHRSFGNVVRTELKPPLPPDSSVATIPNGRAVLSNRPGRPLDDDAPLSRTSCTTTSPSRLEVQTLGTKKHVPKQTMMCDILPVLTRDMEGPFFAIDVECVATGNDTNDRDVARIAVVDEDEKVVFDQYVKPTKPIVSYLTQLTGITEGNLADAPGLEEALVRLKDILPVESVIVGQSIKKDLEWLMLQKPTDYKEEFDVADLFRLPMQSFNGVVRYRYFSLRHVAKYLLGHNIQEADHDPVIDARYAMKVFKQFRYLHENPCRRDAVLQTLLKTPRTPSFAERYPVIDGVSMRAPRKHAAIDSKR